MDLFFIFNVFRNIISTFFMDGIWVVGFFYLFNKTFESDLLKKLSLYAIGMISVLLFLYSVMVSI